MQHHEKRAQAQLDRYVGPERNTEFATEVAMTIIMAALLLPAVIVIATLLPLP